MNDNQIVSIDRELQRDRFVDFERGVLQDNILLCDTKAGLLLAFTGAMVIFCIDAIVKAGENSPGHAAWLVLAMKGLLIAAALGFLVSSHFSLTTVLPRMVRGRADHIFWESPVFKLSPDEYVAQMKRIDPEVEREDQLRHLHLLAGICGGKFRHFQAAMQLARLAFVALVIGEALRMVG